jgi:hypothetical protein
MQKVWKGRDIMKSGKYYLILAVVIGILCVPVLGEVECLSPEYMPVLPDISESAGIVVMISSDCKSNIDSVAWGELHEKVLQRIKKAGFKMYSGPIRVSLMPSTLPVSILRIDVDMLKLDDLQQYVMRIQTSLAIEVSLANEPKRSMKADIWWTVPAMQVVSIEEMPAKVTEVVLHQVDRFIESYFAVNPPNKRPSDANLSVVAPAKTDDISMAPKEQVKPAAKSTLAEYKYVASKNSKVFHRPDCSWAKRIKPENLIGYNSRDEAINAGKRPCRRCNP